MIKFMPPRMMWKRILFLPNIWVMQRSWFLHRRYCEKSLRAWVPRNEHEISDLNIQDDLHEICRRNYLLQVKVANSAHPGGYDWWSWPRHSWFSSDISGYTCSHYEETTTNEQWTHLSPKYLPALTLTVPCCNSRPWTWCSTLLYT